MGSFVILTMIRPSRFRSCSFGGIDWLPFEEPPFEELPRDEPPRDELLRDELPFDERPRPPRSDPLSSERSLEESSSDSLRERRRPRPPESLLSSSDESLVRRPRDERLPFEESASSSFLFVRSASSVSAERLDDPPWERRRERSLVSSALSSDASSLAGESFVPSSRLDERLVDLLLLADELLDVRSMEEGRRLRPASFASSSVASLVDASAAGSSPDAVRFFDVERDDRFFLGLAEDSPCSASASSAAPSLAGASSAESSSVDASFWDEPRPRRPRRLRRRFLEGSSSCESAEPEGWESGASDFAEALSSDGSSEAWLAGASSAVGSSFFLEDERVRRFLGVSPASSGDEAAGSAFGSSFGSSFFARLGGGR